MLIIFGYTLTLSYPLFLFMQEVLFKFALYFIILFTTILFTHFLP